MSDLISVSIFSQRRSHRKTLRSTFKLSSTLAIGGGLLLSALQVQADSTAATATNEDAALGKVVSRAPNQLSVLQDVPKSVSVVTGEELTKLGALNVTDILKRIGNVQWNYGNPKTGSLSIRGVSAGSSEAIDPSLGVVVDGVPYVYVALASAADYVDIHTVNVTRGPQGSTGGKNTSMGTIVITTKQPSFTPEANASLTVGENNAVISEAAIGGPVIDDLLAWRGTFYRNQQDGDYKNLYPDIKGRTSYVNTDRTCGRVQMLLTPTQDFSAKFSYDNKPKGIEFVNGLSIKQQQPAFYADGVTRTYIPNGIPGATNLTQNKLERRYFTSAGSYSYQDYLHQPINEDQNKGIQNGSKGGSVQLNWNVLNHTLQSISAYKDNFFQASNDEGTPFDITKNSGLFVHYKQVSQELSVASNSGGFVDYQTGLFYIRTRSDANSRSRYGSDAGAWFVNDAQYTSLDTNSSGRALMKDSLDRVRATNTTYTENKSGAIFGQADWHPSQPLTLTTGLRFSREDRRTEVEKLVEDNGFNAALNPAQNGGFASNATSGALAATNSAAQLSLADAVANQYFGAAITGTPGAAYNGLTAAQKIQVARSKAVRASQAFNGLYARTKAEPFKDTLTTGNISLSYKLSDSTTTYVSWQHGAKAGISQISGVDGNGVPISRLVDAETSNVYELGTKGSFLEHTLTVNADVFLDRLKNFQQTITIFDPVLTAQNGTSTYTSITGNVPLVEVKGVEIDASYSGIKNLSLRFAGAYNDARYKKSVLLSQPAENGNLTTRFYDANGQTLINAPKYTGNLAGEYRIEVFGNKEFHTNINYNYTSRFNSDAAQSSYAWVNGYGLADFSVGLGRKDQLFDVNFLVKNLFDTRYKYSSTWTSYVPGTARWIGVAFSGKL